MTKKITFQSFTHPKRDIKLGTAVFNLVWIMLFHLLSCKCF